MNMLNCLRLHLYLCLTIEARLVRFDKSTYPFRHFPFQLPDNIVQHKLKLIPEGSTSFGSVFLPILPQPRLVPIMPFWPGLGNLKSSSSSSSSCEENISDLKLNIENWSKKRRQNSFEGILRHFANKKGGLKSIFNKLLLKSKQQGINVCNKFNHLYKIYLYGGSSNSTDSNCVVSL